jgi:DNA repair protein RecO (recombination protein O)
VRVQQQPAYVLHSREYSESSLLLELFTLRYGRLGLIAKGARRPASRMRGVLKPFQSLLASWSGRGELGVLTGAEGDGAGVSLAGAALYCGFYLNELLMRLLHRHDPHEALFAAYRDSLHALTGDTGSEAVLRLFEKRLLREIGYGLVLDRDISDNAPIVPDALYDFIPERGPVRLPHPELNTRLHGVRMRGTSLLALAHESLDDPVARREAKQLMRTVLARYLGNKPLHSRRLFATATAARAGGAHEEAGE